MAGRASIPEEEGQVHFTMKLDGQGSVEQLEKGVPRGKCRKWRLWIRAEGKNRSRRFAGTYREALKALESFKAEVAAEVPCSETFAAYAASWAEMRAASGSYDPNTTAKDKRHVRALTLVLGPMAMDAITSEVCRDALARIKHGENASGRELTNTTMEGMHVCLRLILQQAEDDGRIAANPMRKVKLPKRDTREREALSSGELQLLLNRIDAELPLDGRVMALYLMCCLGLRRGEACALLDSDVSGGFARVHLAVKETNGKFGSPKSRAGIRTLPVPSRLQAKIDEWREVRAVMGLGDAPTLACDTAGGVLWPQNLRRWWAGGKHHVGVRDSLGCKGMTLHDLRHANITMMARHLSPFDLQRWAGWSSIAPAMIYVHDDMASVTAGVTGAWGGVVTESVTECRR